MTKRTEIDIDSLPKIGGLPSWRPAFREREKTARNVQKVRAEDLYRFPKPVLEEIGRQLAERGVIRSDWDGKSTSDGSIKKPKTYGECLAKGWGTKDRPCPFVSCSNHLYIDVKDEERGIVYNFPDMDVDQLEETCSLRVADGDNITLEKVGELLDVTRERIRQIELAAMAKIRDMGIFEPDDERAASRRIKLRVVR